MLVHPRPVSATPTTDSSGTFAVSTVPPGLYDVEINFAQALSKLSKNLTVTAGNNPVHEFGLLAVGDMNNDDAVDLLGFSLLRTNFGQVGPQVVP